MPVHTKTEASAVRDARAFSNENTDVHADAEPMEVDDMDDSAIAEISSDDSDIDYVPRVSSRYSVIFS